MTQRAHVSAFVDTAQVAPEAKPKRLRLLAYGNHPIVENILENVSVRYGVTPTQLRSKDRHKSIARARHVAAWLMRQADMSYPEIGVALAKDHSTIMNAVSRVEQWLAREPRHRATIESMIVVRDAPEVRLVPGVGMVLDDYSAEAMATAIGVRSGPIASSGSNRESP